MLPWQSSWQYPCRTLVSKKTLQACAHLEALVARGQPSGRKSMRGRGFPAEANDTREMLPSCVPDTNTNTSKLAVSPHVEAQSAVPSGYRWSSPRAFVKTGAGRCFNRDSEG